MDEGWWCGFGRGAGGARVSDFFASDSRALRLTKVPAAREAATEGSVLTRMLSKRIPFCGEEGDGEGDGDEVVRRAVERRVVGGGGGDESAGQSHDTSRVGGKQQPRPTETCM